MGDIRKQLEAAIGTGEPAFLILGDAESLLSFTHVFEKSKGKLTQAQNIGRNVISERLRIGSTEGPNSDGIKEKERYLCLTGFIYI